ncbi:MAG: hypothetical protein IJV71_10135, partial [Lachnospiraceae bacterium]|nr:hypothetical protein [Lachnospiraceae bacterium]
IPALEVKKLYKNLKTISIISGVYGQNIQTSFLEMRKCSEIIRNIQPDHEHSKREADFMQLLMIMKCLYLSRLWIIRNIRE